MTQFGSYFQAVVGKYQAVTRRSGVTPKQVHIVAVHGHNQVPEGSFIRDAGNSDLLSPDILSVVTGREVQMVLTSIFRLDKGFKAAKKNKTLKSGLCRALP